MEEYGMIRQAVGIGSVCAQKGSCELISYAIGSCIALCMYEELSQVVSMAHILLPSSSREGHREESMDTRFADVALRSALSKMLALGADRRSIRAAIIGGAEMFPHGDCSILNIGKMNSECVAAELRKSGIPLEFTELGGNRSRTVIFRIPGNGSPARITVKSPYCEGKTPEYFF